MITRSAIEAEAQTHHLIVSGLLLPDTDEPVPEGTQTIVLLSPDEPVFWSHFQASPEFRDGAADPLDRWTLRALASVTAALPGAVALFPFGGPPWQPFIAWARRSGRAHPSPVGLLAHDDAGLFVSYRAALAIPFHIPIPPRTEDSPCLTCAAPCLTACPVDAFASGQYDVPRCKAHLDVSDSCAAGCLVRRACPVGQDRRLPAQSAFHMKAFHDP